MVVNIRFDGSADTGAWERMIHDVFGDVELTIPDRAAFKGIIRSAPVGPIEINTVRCSYEDARRTKAQAARSSEASFALSFVQRGELTLEQFDRTCTIGSGSFVLFDLSAPYAYKHSGWTDVLSIKLPLSLLETRLGRCQGRVARAGRADRGIVRVTQEALGSLAREAANVPAHLAQQCAAGMLDLIAIALDCEHGSDMPIGNAVSRTQIFRRALAYIDANIRDHDLDVARIAAAHRISVRYLHQIFQENGRSVGEAVRSLRLERCRRDLSAVRDRVVPIKEIAFRAGFRSPSHFATAFRREYGISPTDLRQASANQQGIDTRTFPGVHDRFTGVR